MKLNIVALFNKMSFGIFRESFPVGYYEYSLAVVGCLFIALVLSTADYPGTDLYHKVYVKKETSVVP